ncbi:MAG: hypothetical protein ACD_65C00155G0001 [uncultured bacterium]|nr:MAG: hypothetical protein ACD_65C00155G0001 [uncultured bacterium]
MEHCESQAHKELPVIISADLYKSFGFPDSFRDVYVLIEAVPSPGGRGYVVQESAGDGNGQNKNYKYVQAERFGFHFQLKFPYLFDDSDNRFPAYPYKYGEKRPGRVYVQELEGA